MECAQACPACRALAVELDVVQGLMVCEACGRVLSDSELVAAPGDAGVHVGAGDGGRLAGALALRGSAAGAAALRALPYDGAARTAAAARELAARLELPPPVAAQAAALAERLAPLVRGTWPRALVAGAAAYAAVRLARLPLTLLDAAAPLQVPPHALGRHYRAALRELGLAPPAVAPADLLERGAAALAAALAAAGRAGRAPPPPRRLAADAGVLLAWMEGHISEVHPLVNAAAALACAAEAGGARVRGADAAAALGCAPSRVDARLARLRRLLVAAAAPLPYAARVTPRNVAQHALTIVRAAGLVGAARLGAAPPALPPARPPPAPRLEGARRGEAPPRKAGIKRRRQERGGGRGGGGRAAEAAAEAAEADDGGALSDVDVDEYLRPAEEVAAYRELLRRLPPAEA